jgi:hypothetical protein
VVPELFLLLDIAFVDLDVPLVTVQITITMEPSGSSRRNKSLSRALASPKDAPQKLDTGLHPIKQMNTEDGFMCAQGPEQRSSGCSISCGDMCAREKTCCREVPLISLSPVEDQKSLESLAD